MIIVVEWSGWHRRRPNRFKNTHFEGEAARLVVVEQNMAGEAASDEGVDESDLCTRCTRLHLTNRSSHRAHVEVDITGMTV